MKAPFQLAKILLSHAMEEETVICSTTEIGTAYFSIQEMAESTFTEGAASAN